MNLLELALFRSDLEAVSRSAGVPLQVSSIGRANKMRKRKLSRN